MAEWDEQKEAGTLKNDIQNIIDALNTHHRNVNISRVTGSSVAIATGLPAAACAIAAPFTLGVTLIPAIVLGIIAAVGGGVSVGATVAGYFIKRQKVKEVQEKWDIFRQTFIANHEDIAEVRDLLLSLSQNVIANHEDIAEVRDLLLKLNPRTSGAAITPKDALKGAAEFVRTSGGISSAVVRGTLRSTAAGVRITAPLLAAASVVALPLDIVDLVTASLALHRGEQSTATESLTHIFSCNPVAKSSTSETKQEEEALELTANSRV
ncbi:hypothetical protein C0Q70_20632 [Pomacea canaliculata]|uniref:Uncharacterized protein n=1 Tax=Pomacea canaliculata TaxID=400727 RepID=A0A2T7NG46_POMCA|nr:hypothetical protein C0Q70_20632 [Pomacea canaliculata]